MIALLDYTSQVQRLDDKAMAEAKSIQDSLTKPNGSLGRLENLSVQLAGIYRTPYPEVRRKVVFTMAADHGVAAEGVSAYPSAVTAQMVLNFARGGAAINVLARKAGAVVRVVDIGVASDMDWPEGVLSRKVAKGSANMARGPALTNEQATEALLIGAELASEAADSGVNAIAIGDMGIGNTTAASAITAVMTGRPVADVTGRGTGVDDSVLSLKIKVIEKALEVNRLDSSDGFDVLSKVGGLEIAGLAGIAIGAASRGVPVFLDGFVSSSAALIASAICPDCREYMIASHVSVEPGHRYALEHLALEPVLDLGMRLGEGTGAALAFFIAEAACRIINEMATFDSAGVSRSDKEMTE
ncbi:MAG: nicotinate-nucleotide--dimethylbenzimidazole phosphoribosyltransferase [Methanobacteriota archaeon]|nr:MAG: nicotinate-nucleotide--dimethylbenzimidazole phosphoribosyltransferase [Euryarchaeota archaeon]